AWEFLTIALGVPRRRRKPEQRALMRAAARHHGLRWGVGLFAILLVIPAVQYYLVRVRGAAESHVQAVLVSSAAEVPQGIEQLRSFRGVAPSLLRERYGDLTADPRHRL